MTAIMPIGVFTFEENNEVGSPSTVPGFAVGIRRNFRVAVSCLLLPLIQRRHTS
jgi:hypothetical protein